MTNLYELPYLTNHFMFLRFGDLPFLFSAGACSLKPAEWKQGEIFLGDLHSLLPASGNSLKLAEWTGGDLASHLKEHSC